MALHNLHLFLLTNDEDNLIIKFHVFNRFGQRVFFSRDAHIGWGGTFHELQCDMGTYFYELSAIIGDTEYYLKGDVTLIR